MVNLTHCDRTGCNHTGRGHTGHNCTGLDHTFCDRTGRDHAGVYPFKYKNCTVHKIHQQIYDPWFVAIIKNCETQKNGECLNTDNTLILF